jgi:uncharacterized protein
MSAPAANPIEVFRGQDFYVPAFLIRIGLRDLKDEMRDIQSVSYTDSLTEIDSADITVNNWDPETRRFKYSDGDTFNPWKEIEVFMGYFQNGCDNRRLMLSGHITTMTPNFPSSGGPTLTVRALNMLHRFRFKQETKRFSLIQDSNVAVQLVGGIAEQVKQSTPNILLQLDDTDVKRNLEHEGIIPSLAMDNQFPIMFLMERARRIGYELTITEGKPRPDKKRALVVHFRPPSYVVRPTYVLEWGVSP